MWQNAQIWQSWVGKIDINLYTFFLYTWNIPKLKENVFTYIGRVPQKSFTWDL